MEETTTTTTQQQAYLEHFDAALENGDWDEILDIANKIIQDDDDDTSLLQEKNESKDPQPMEHSEQQQDGKQTGSKIFSIAASNGDKIGGPQSGRAEKTVQKGEEPKYTGMAESTKWWASRQSSLLLDIERIGAEFQAQVEDKADRWQPPTFLATSKHENNPDKDNDAFLEQLIDARDWQAVDSFVMNVMGVPNSNDHVEVEITPEDFGFQGLDDFVTMIMQVYNGDA